MKESVITVTCLYIFVGESTTEHLCTFISFRLVNHWVRQLLINHRLVSRSVTELERQINLRDFFNKILCERLFMSSTSRPSIKKGPALFPIFKELCIQEESLVESVQICPTVPKIFSERTTFG